MSNSNEKAFWETDSRLVNKEIQFLLKNSLLCRYIHKILALYSIQN